MSEYCTEPLTYIYTSGLPPWREKALSKIIQNGRDYESVAMVFIA